MEGNKLPYLVSFIRTLIVDKHSYNYVKHAIESHFEIDTYSDDELMAIDMDLCGLKHEYKLFRSDYNIKGDTIFNGSKRYKIILIGYFGWFVEPESEIIVDMPCPLPNDAKEFFDEQLEHIISLMPIDNFSDSFKLFKRVVNELIQIKAFSAVYKMLDTDWYYPVLFLDRLIVKKLLHVFPNDKYLNDQLNYINMYLNDGKEFTESHLYFNSDSFSDEEAFYSGLLKIKF